METDIKKFDISEKMMEFGIKSPESFKNYCDLCVNIMKHDETAMKEQLEKEERDRDEQNKVIRDQLAKQERDRDEQNKVIRDQLAKQERDRDAYYQHNADIISCIFNGFMDWIDYNSNKEA